MTARTIGASATKHLLYTADIIDAERALRIGLIDELVEPVDGRDRLDELVERITSHRSLLTQMASKQMVDDVVRDGSVAGSTTRRWNAELAGSADAREEVRAFAEGRQPDFDWAPRDS